MDLTYNKNNMKILFLILIYSILSQLNIIFKYNGNFWDGDALLMCYYSSQIFESGSIFVDHPYVSGINYQIFASMISHICQFDMIKLYSYTIPLINSLAILIIYIIMVELTENKKVALLSTLLILFQSDFLLLIHRSKHDFYSYILGLLFFICFLKYINESNYSKKVNFYILSFIFLISFSYYSLPFFSLFLCAIIIYFVLYLFFQKYITLNAKQNFDVKKSILHFILIGFIFITVLNHEIYPSFKSFYHYLGHFFESFSLLFYEPSIQSQDGYSNYISNAYSSYLKFLILYSYNLLLFLLSFFSLLKLRKSIKYETKLIFISFILLVFLMLISDKVGFAGNMGLRAFYFAVIPAVAISSTYIVHYINSSKFNLNKLLILIVVICVLFSTANVKSTADSKWIDIPFNYFDAEAYSLKFAECSNIAPIFVDHRLEYVGAAYTSPHYWNRQKFITDLSRYFNCSESGGYVYSSIYSSRGYRDRDNFTKLTYKPKNFELNQKIYDTNFTEIYVSKNPS